MTVFETAYRDIIYDPNLSVAAIYEPTSGEPASIRVIFGQPVDTALGGALTVDGLQIEALASDVPGIGAGARIVINQATYQVIGEVRHDPMRVTATAMVRRVP